MNVRIEIQDHVDGELALIVECTDEDVISQFQKRGFEGNGYTWQGLVESALRLVALPGDQVSHSPEADGAMLRSRNRALLEAVADELRRAFAEEAAMEALLRNADPDRIE